MSIQKERPAQKCAGIHNRYLIFAPNGQRASMASLRHCRPNGMPIILMKNMKAAMQYKIASHQPTMSSHKTFIMGCAPKSGSTSEPKGRNVRRANFKHCIPNGIPMIVKQSSRPDISHISAGMKPTSKIQKILPIILI